MIANSKFPETYHFTYILVGIKTNMLDMKKQFSFKPPLKSERKQFFLNLEVWSRLHLDINSYFWWCTLSLWRQSCEYDLFSFPGKAPISDSPWIHCYFDCKRSIVICRCGGSSAALEPIVRMTGCMGVAWWEGSVTLIDHLREGSYPIPGLPCYGVKLADDSTQFIY